MWEDHSANDSTDLWKNEEHLHQKESATKNCPEYNQYQVSAKDQRTQASQLRFHVMLMALAEDGQVCREPSSYVFSHAEPVGIGACQSVGIASPSCFFVRCQPHGPGRLKTEQARARESRFTPLPHSISSPIHSTLSLSHSRFLSSYIAAALEAFGCSGPCRTARLRESVEE